MKTIIEEFYEALSNLDADTMVKCYHDNITFQDPAFGILKGKKAGNMWKMLCESQKSAIDFQVEVSNIQYEGELGKAHVEAHYTFSRTGRRVHNIIDANFKFQDGKIIGHRDDFDLYRWSRQAFGLTGLLLGWTGYFKKKLNAQTNKLLSRFEEKRGL